jgi:ribosomal protein L7/L12
MNDLVRLLESKADVEGFIRIHTDYLKAYRDLVPDNYPDSNDKANELVGELTQFNQACRDGFYESKIMAIKTVRAKTGCGLKEGKEYIESMHAWS